MTYFKYPCHPCPVTVAIQVEGLTKRFGEIVALDAVDFSVPERSVFGLLGPNGAGKTTTILMLLGLSEPAEGEARVVGLDPTRRPLEVKRVVGYLPDNVGFYAGMTGRQNLDYTARLNGIPLSMSDQRIGELLETVGLTEAADLPAGTYSRGMRQRLGIADALVKDPHVLILDEPTVGIDPEGVQDILDLIHRLPRERGVTVLLSSHLLYQVQEICDRMGIFVRGRLIAEGGLADLGARLVTRRLLIEVGAAGTREVEDALRAISGVEAVEREGEIWAVIADRDVRYQISTALSERGFPMFHLRRRGEELDEIYRRYFEEEGRNGG